MTVTRAGSWSQFERRFCPIAHSGGSLIWDYADLPQPVDAHRLWTVVDCGGRLFAAAGFHYVNRIGYLRTEHAWDQEDEQRDYRYD